MVVNKYNGHKNEAVNRDVGKLLELYVQYLVLIFPDCNHVLCIIIVIFMTPLTENVEEMLVLGITCLMRFSKLSIMISMIIVFMTHQPITPLQGSRA